MAAASGRRRRSTARRSPRRCAPGWTASCPAARRRRATRRCSTRSPRRSTRWSRRWPTAQHAGRGAGRGDRGGGGRPRRDDSDAGPQGPGELPGRAQRRAPGPRRDVRGAAGRAAASAGRLVTGRAQVGHRRRLAQPGTGRGSGGAGRGDAARRAGRAIEIAAGLDDETFGTDAVQIAEAIGRADSGRRRRRADGPRQRGAVRRARPRPDGRRRAGPGGALPRPAGRGPDRGGRRGAPAAPPATRSQPRPSRRWPASSPTSRTRLRRPAAARPRRGRRAHGHLHAREPARAARPPRCAAGRGRSAGWTRRCCCATGPLGTGLGARPRACRGWPRSARSPGTRSR